MAALDQTDEPYQVVSDAAANRRAHRQPACSALRSFDLVMGVWHIPGSQHKNKAPHTVPLLAEAIESCSADASSLEGDLFGCGPAQRARRDT